MALYREMQPDPVITDIVMPNQEGIETILTPRRDDNPVKIIAISGADIEMLETARLIGADAILENPFRAHELVSRVRALAGPATPSSRTEHRQRQRGCATLQPACD